MIRSANRVIASGLGTVALIAVAGCGAGSSGQAASGGRGETTLVGHSEPLHRGSLTASDIAAADTAFGFRLFGKLCGAAPDINLTLSPASAAETLGMLDAGSVGSTRAAVSRLLGLPTWSPAVVAAVHDQSAALATVSQITVSNHLFEQDGATPAKRALDDLQTAYSSDLRELDFAHAPRRPRTRSTTSSVRTPAG